MAEHGSEEPRTGIGAFLKSVQGAILAAGALAVAIGAIWALVPRDDASQVEFVSLSTGPTMVTLSQFQPTRTSTLGRVAFTGSTASPTEPSSTSATEPTATDPPSTSPATSPTSTPETPPVSPSATATTGRPRLPRAYLAAVTDAVLDAGYYLTQGDLGDSIPIPATGQDLGPEGQLLPAAEAAEEIVQTLTQVRARPHRGKEDPLGIVLRATIHLRNADGLPVRIYWELEGGGKRTQQLTDDWLRGAPAYEVTATSDDDTGTFKLWVPVPEARGDYVVTLVAHTSDGELPDDAISTEEFH